MQNLAQVYASVRPPYILPYFSTPSRNVIHRRLCGFGASPGIFEGPCKVITDLEDLKALPDGAMVALETAPPTVLPFIPLLGGMITERGGSMSIVSGYARKCGIPAVVGVEGLMDSVQDGDIIRLDGATGTLDVIG